MNESDTTSKSVGVAAHVFFWVGTFLTSFASFFPERYPNAYAYTFAASFVLLAAAWVLRPRKDDLTVRNLYWIGLILRSVAFAAVLAQAPMVGPPIAPLGLNQGTAFALLNGFSVTTDTGGTLLMVVGWIKRPAEIAPTYIAHSNSPAMIAVLRQMRDRADTLRMAALASLLLILASLAIGFVLFAEAEETSTSVPQKVEDTLYSQWQGRQTLIASIGSRLVAQKDMSAETRADLEKQRARAVEEMEKLEARLTAAREAVKSADSVVTETKFLVSVLSKRIGSVLLLIFLVQILVTLYRYSSRLAAFYDSRADALQLVPIEAFDSAETSVAVLGPDKLDFGKTPRSAIENAVDLAKEILKLRKKDEAEE